MPSPQAGPTPQAKVISPHDFRKSEPTPTSHLLLPDEKGKHSPGTPWLPIKFTILGGWEKLQSWYLGRK
jgi:hypothetical protein